MTDETRKLIAKIKYENESFRIINEAVREMYERQQKRTSTDEDKSS